MNCKKLTHQDYSVGWVCALHTELTAAMFMLDETHAVLSKPPSDKNTYTLGSIGGHNIAIACLPAGDMGENPAATVATRMTSTFPGIRFWLMVGIGGGMPPKVRLGDVVVSTPAYATPGVIQWDLGIAHQGNNFERCGALNRAPEELRTAVTTLQARHNHPEHATHLPAILEEVRSKGSDFPNLEGLKDVLFRADYHHIERIIQVKGKEDDNGNYDYCDTAAQIGMSDCWLCDTSKEVERPPRSSKIEIHYGLIASGNQVIKDAIRRNAINKQLGGDVLCFEMEAAGIMNSHPCLVIRGICDYSDSHKNYKWQKYAAIVAAAYAKELLGIVAPHDVHYMPAAADAAQYASEIFYHFQSMQLKNSQTDNDQKPSQRLSSYSPTALPSEVIKWESSDAQIFQLCSDVQRRLDHPGAWKSDTTIMTTQNSITEFTSKNLSQALSLVKQGNDHLNRNSGESTADHLSYAANYFFSALRLILDLNVDPDNYAKILHKLMNVESDMSFNEDLSIEENNDHLKRASDLGQVALAAAQKTQNSNAKGFIRLDHVFIEAHVLELNPKRATTEEVRNEARELSLRITRIFQGLENHESLKTREMGNYVKYWQNRLFLLSK